MEQVLSTVCLIINAEGAGLKTTYFVMSHIIISITRCFNYHCLTLIIKTRCLKYQCMRNKPYVLGSTSNSPRNLQELLL